MDYVSKNKPHNMIAILERLWETLYDKVEFIVGLTWALSFLLPIKDFLLLTAFLTVADALSGVLAAKKRGEAIASRKFYRTVEKFAVYFMSILAAAGVHAAFIKPNFGGYFPHLPLIEVVAASICFTEFLSLKENVLSLTGVDILGGFKKVYSQFMDLLPTKKEEK